VLARIVCSIYVAFASFEIAVISRCEEEEEERESQWDYQGGRRIDTNCGSPSFIIS